MDIIIIVMLLWAGGYSLFAAIRIKTKCELVPSKIVYPGNCAPADCTDPSGFISFIIPRLVILGSILVFLGIFTALYKFGVLAFIPEIVDLAVVPGVALAVFAWYIVAQNKAAKRFW